MSRANIGLVLSALVFSGVTLCRAQGETTSAIAGQVTDSTGAAIPKARVAITNRETGLERAAQSDVEGEFNFPQLAPGAYSLRVEAAGFAAQEIENVFADLGQRQTVNVTLRVAESRQTIEVNSVAPLINPGNPNTSTNLNAPALESLPNPGGDLTYPLQFAPGALINTAGSSNDFVGGTNGYGNVQFNGLPALSNGYIVDGLETNDPLTNLNSGLSTNLVLGLNSIAEVSVNTLSYSVDQGRYGASQVNYVTKSGTNQFHGSLYEIWEGSILSSADFFSNATPGNHKPRSTVNHFGGSVGGPIARDKLFFFFDSEWVRIALPIVTPVTVPTVALQEYVLQQLPIGGTDAVTGSHYPAAPQQVPFYQKMFALYANALHRVAEAIVADRSLDMLYSDEDKLELDGRHVEPFFKPDWSPELLLACMYTCHLGVYRTRLVRQIGGFRSEFDSAQDYDLVLRLMTQTARIQHIPDVLYHSAQVAEFGRDCGGSQTACAGGRPAGARRTISGARPARARSNPGRFAGLHRVRFAIADDPQISIIIPMHAGRPAFAARPAYHVLRCVESIRSPDHLSQLRSPAGPSSRRSCAGLGPRAGRLDVARLARGGPFNWSAAMNLGAGAAGGDHLLFLNDDMEIITPDWLECLLEFSQ